MNWTDFKVFKGIDLNDSFVINWNHENDQIIFEIEASIWPESEHYQEPSKLEYTCYRKARLIFTEINGSKGLLRIDTVKFTEDPNGSLDYGVIESLSRTSIGYQISGDFGSVDIIGGRILFEIHA